LFFKNGMIESYRNYRMGTHRVIESTRKNVDDEQEAFRLMEEHIQTQLDSLIEEYEPAGVEELVYIGYEIQMNDRVTSACDVDLLFDS